MLKKVTKQALAAEYSVSLRTVTNWMRNRRISYLKIGRLVRFDSMLVDQELRTAGLLKAK